MATGETSISARYNRGTNVSKSKNLGEVMNGAKVITSEILEDYLSCKTKAYLRLRGQHGASSDYDILQIKLRDEVRHCVKRTIAGTHVESGVVPDQPTTVSVLKRAAEFVLDARIEDGPFSLLVDGSKRVSGESRLGDFHYVPVMYYQGETIRQNQKQVIAIVGGVLGKLQGKQPTNGLVYHGPNCKATKVKITAVLQERARRLLDEITELCGSSESPRLMLNKHCHSCQFQDRCRAKAMEDDDLSLLGGISEKEIRRYNRKGIFTVTQLSCTFRLRKQGKRVKRLNQPHNFALQAAAIRDSKVYVLKAPALPESAVQIYLDLEGNQDRRSVYLAGMLIVDNGTESWHSFWADDCGQEPTLIKQLLKVVRSYDDFLLFHYGSYETTFFKRIQQTAGNKAIGAELLKRSCNLLSVIHSHIYFPVYSNGLKNVGRYLGCTWSDEKAGGLQSIVWRQLWRESRDSTIRQTLEKYNQEDCLALRRVAGFLTEVSAVAASNSPEPLNDLHKPTVEMAECINPQTSRRELGPGSFVTQELEFVNKCAYFDYQRDKVFLRTNDTLRRIHKQKRNTKRRTSPRVNKTIRVNGRKCPHCGSAAIVRHNNDTHTKLAYDLKLSGTGIRRQVIACTAVRHSCEKCGKRFLPPRYKKRAKYFHSLQSWAMYQHIVHRMSFQQLEEMIHECFGVPINYQEIFMFKLLLARYYRSTYQRIITRITSGEIVHADETHINLQKGKGYVWVITNMEDVAYIYRPTREGEWFRELLHDFRGVLITDFYSAYDSISCEQQKCLIHLIRDMNHDLRGAAYDEEFRWLVIQFGVTLRGIIASIDRYGLQQRHLNKHRADVDRFFGALGRRRFESELAIDYRKRLQKYRTKLFTFLNHSGVPWNNNNAEHAIKRFAYYRNIVDGKVTEAPLRDYLILLTLQQTCKYRGLSFLKFLLSGEKEIDEYRDSVRPKSKRLTLEVYPAGYSSFFRSKRESQPED